jgi:hypothetical protein
METGSFGVPWRPRRRGLLALVAAALVAAAAVGLFLAGHEFRPAVGTDEGLGAATGLGQLSGLLPEDLIEESAIQVDLTNETVRLPLYPGKAHGKKVWYVLLDASDAGLAHDLGLTSRLEEVA